MIKKTLPIMPNDEKKWSEVTSDHFLNIRGAERIRTAASRFCRPLPYHLGTAPYFLLVQLSRAKGTTPYDKYGREYQKTTLMSRQYAL